mmetsp:Transcript_49525/g.115865  ORF Transcript_49525/g.115865 Transcript_49525/m.115865 type:complete len:927 (+) Transcript_49525:61-2841(+)
MVIQQVVGGFRPGSLVKVDGRALAQVIDYDRAAERFKVSSVDEGAQVDVAPSQIAPAVTLGKPGQGGAKDSFDIFKGPLTSLDCLTQELDSCILEKGFCVVRTNHSTDELAEAHAAMGRMADAGHLSRLPEEVEEGYLGAGGRGKVVWLDDSSLVECPALSAVEDGLSELAEAYQPYSLDSLGKLLAERTAPLASLSLVGLDEEEYPYPIADDKQLGDFLQMWRRSLLRAVHFLGPGTAEVTFVKKEQEDGMEDNIELTEVQLSCPPNTLLVYRPMKYEYAVDVGSDVEVLSVSTNYLSPGPVFELMPYDCDPKLLSNLADGPSAPSRMEVSVVGMGTRLSGGLDDASMFRWSLDLGTDLAIEIPYMRYNVYEYWAPDPDDLTDPWKSQLHRHQSYVDAVELFDHKFFDINAVEAQAMSPMQRQVLECGSDLLYQVGITKKIANKTVHHAGVSVGLDKDDYPGLGILTKGNGNNVIAITANRFSFAFNLRGPNYVCDTACSAALVATHYARLGLLRTEFDPQVFHVAMGCHLLLAPRGGANPTFTKTGRCFTFDNSADGYLPGEGTSGMIIKAGPEPEDRYAMLRSSGVGQNGRSATLTAPNGPAQEQLILRVLHEGGVLPEEAAAWECHGTGTSLGDPIEVGAIRRIMVKRDRQEPLMMSSDKSNMGHMEGGAAMAGMIKCAHQVYAGCTLPTIHLGVLNANMDEGFEANYQTETSGFYYLNGHSEISSFGFGGTNGHMIFWGESLVRIPDAKTAVMKRIKGMAPPEVRPISADPDNWDSDFWDAAWKPDDKYTIPIDPSDPAGTSIHWVKEEQETSEDSLYGITGNFNEWGNEEIMVAGDLPGVYVANLVIPDDGFLEFRFLIDGDDAQAIGPDSQRCTKKLPPSMGPAADVNTSWMIAGIAGEEVQVELFSLTGKHALTWIKR